MSNINSRLKFRRVSKLSKASPEVLYTLWAESPFHDSMCLDGVGCANSLGDTVWSQRVGCRQLQPWIGPHGGQWTMCVQPKQTQPHSHSGGPVGAQTTGASGSCQTDQCKLWGNLSRGSDTPLLSVSPLVQDPWGEPVGGIECEEDGKPL